MANEKATLDSIKASLHKIGDDFSEGPDEFIYKYLKTLYRLRESLGRSPPKNIFEYFDGEWKKMHGNVQHSYFRVMIQHNKPEWVKPQYTSRYANALEFAFEKEISSKRIIKFLKSQGGYKKCDALYRKKYVKRKRNKRAVARKRK